MLDKHCYACQHKLCGYKPRQYKVASIAGALSKTVWADLTCVARTQCLLAKPMS